MIAALTNDFWIVLAALTLLVLLVSGIRAARAPEGFEDETGFHYRPTSKSDAPPAVKPLSPVTESRLLNNRPPACRRQAGEILKHGLNTDKPKKI